MPQCVAASEPVRPARADRGKHRRRFSRRSEQMHRGWFTLGPDRGDPERNDSLGFFRIQISNTLEFFGKASDNGHLAEFICIRISARLSESSGALCEQIQPFIFDLQEFSGRTRRAK